jgi:hypothetical protein
VNAKRLGRKRSPSRYYPSIHLEEPRKITRNILDQGLPGCDDMQCCGRIPVSYIHADSHLLNMEAT